MTYDKNPDQIQRLVSKIWALHQQKPSSKRILIGICGIPGAGKSTIAQKVADAVNIHASVATSNDNPNFAANIPMDGYHYSRDYLASMPDPSTAIHRRGAAFTFDAEGFHFLVQRLNEPITDTPTYAPSFDHAVKDPVADGIAILPSTRVVLLEGNYLALDREPWKAAAELLDEIWHVDVDREVARKRLAKRHVASGIVPDEAAAQHRISSTDFLNADDIEANMLPVQEVIPNNG